MANTGPAELLATWEAGLAHQGPGRALLLHRAARPEAGTDELLSMPVGEREADLYALRRALFGARMQVRVECGACGEDMEFELDAGELVAGGPGARPRRGEGPLRVEEGEWTVEFRLPTVADLESAASAAASGATATGATASRAAAFGATASGATTFGGAPPAGAAAEAGDEGAGSLAALARRLLLARCTVSATRAGRPVPADQLPTLRLPEAVQRRIAEAAERADPAAEVTLRIACPECGEATPAELDIASYLWTELDSWARDLLLDVHLLATAYGWSEPEILALSPLRRRYYLELCADV
ncbi:hypothetical protein AB0E27_21515 [Streptomyces sparsogenes]|uniref:hypothetical protein n=1 Tax=Streptomyces sparsogenes TaxID=67365 RepID=UPI003407B9B7